jgi:pullulanase
VETVNAIVSAVHERHPDVIFYGEGWELPTVPTKPVKLATQKNSHLTPGFAYFSDTIRDLLRGSVWDDEELGFVSGRKGLKPLLDKCMIGLPNWCVDPAQSINYASCHDNMTLFDRIAVSLPNASQETVVRMNNLAAAIYMTAQGIPFIHAGEELLRTKNFDHNSYKSPDSVNSIKWDTLCQSDVQQTLAYYKGLIRMRKRFPVLRQCSAEAVRQTVKPVPGLPEHTAAYGLKGEQELFIIFHAGTEEIAIDLPAGCWQVLVYGDTAGYVPLFTAERTISVPPISAAVLTKAEFV